MVRLIDRPAMTIAVDLGRKATKQMLLKVFIDIDQQSTFTMELFNVTK